MTTKNPILYIVIPVYNEQRVLPITLPQFEAKLYSLIHKKKVSDKSKILFVNDGSSDKTWKVIQKYSATNSLIQGISLSRNRGHQNALLAGLMEAKNYSDITISIDCDGQDDINAIDKMVDAYQQGYEIVYGVRSSRKTDTFFKRFTAQSFYKILSWMGAEVIYNHADYRLISSRVLDEFEDFREVNLFLRGMVPLVGFNSTTVKYERDERVAGESHYSLKKMVALAINGITSLSVQPLRMITRFGVLISIASALFLICALITGKTIFYFDAWEIVVGLVCFMSGLQFVAMGILGEYIGKIYLEAKRRPRYIISERTWVPVVGKHAK